MRQWMKALCDCKGISPLYAAPQGVEVTTRVKEEKEFTFVLNHTDQMQKMNIGKHEQKELLSGLSACGDIELPPKSVMIFEMVKEAETDGGSSTIAPTICESAG
ncbi:Beta-galactosidase C-terminal domain [Paenibacillus hexagrammi]|uniref:Beta-galactosidase C-terminal domain n=1 Tax=Paenibacillus hexagrammi TaxID=2908839 RepID=UPI003862198F